MLASLFKLPLAVPTNPMMFIWIFPISLAIALVYKAIRLEDFSFTYIFKEVLFLFMTIVGTLMASALLLWGITLIVYR